MRTRHSAVVRLTHWITTGCVAALLVSGVAILLAHPRLYWGETGAVGGPSLLDLPLPFMLTGQSGWGRSLHFLAAWIAIGTGFGYVAHGLSTRHFRDHLVPARRDLGWRALARVVRHHFARPHADEAGAYNPLQQVAYLSVVVVLGPLLAWTGFAMSPALTSVFPILVEVFGGQQSARTIHFFAALALTAFVVVHVAMVCRADPVGRVRAMITGCVPSMGAANGEALRERRETGRSAPSAG